MSNQRNPLALQNSETSSSASSSCPSPPSSPHSIMNEYIKSVTERMIHLSVLEVGRMGNDGIGIVQLHNIFDFGASSTRRTCACCAVVCASGCGCGFLSAEENTYNGVNNGSGGPTNFGRGSRGFDRKFGRRWRRNGKGGRLDTIREGTNGNEQNGERARRGTSERGRRRRGQTNRRNELQRAEWPIRGNESQRKPIRRNNFQRQLISNRRNGTFQQQMGGGNNIYCGGRSEEGRVGQQQQSFGGRGGRRGRHMNNYRGRRGDGAGRGRFRGTPFVGQEVGVYRQIDGLIRADFSVNNSSNDTYNSRFVLHEWRVNCVDTNYRGDLEEGPKLVYRNEEGNADDHFYY